MVAALPLALVVALVAEDQAALRAAARDSAPRQAELWRGDWLEIRGRDGDFLQVYDHRRERPGYVRTWQVRTYPVEAASAPALRTVVVFLRDAPGFESLGLGAAALFLKAAPAAEVAAASDVYDALGVMADRLARRASRARARPGSQLDRTLSAHLEVAASYGVRLVTLETPGGQTVCYDGEAFRRVLAVSHDPAERARAALGLTPLRCLDPHAAVAAVRAWNEWRRAVLDRVEPAAAPAPLGDRLRLRRAEVLARLAHDLGSRGDRPGAAKAEEQAVRALALVSRRRLPEEDGATYDDAAVRVAASRWAAEAAPAPAAGDRPALRLVAGRPGETCMELTQGQEPAVLARRCSYGLVWPASARVAPSGAAVVVAVQPLPAWTELWVFRRGAAGQPWDVETLTPAAVEPTAGYVEAAGFTPDSARLLVAREAVVEGRLRRSFEVLRLATLAAEQRAASPERLAAFRRWAAAEWRARSPAGGR